MLLIGRNASPYVRRVAVTLRLLGIPYEQKSVSVIADPEAVRPFNPLVRVPALVLDDGEVLVDSAAIVDHLAELGGAERALMPRSGPERRRVLHALALATGAAEKFVAAHYERTRRPPEFVHPPWIELCEAQAHGGLAALEAMRPEPFLANGALSQADLFAAIVVGFMRRFRPEFFRDHSYPFLDRLAARCEERPEFVATRPEG